MTPALRFYFSILDKVAPQYAARKMFHVLSNPRQTKLRDFENEILDTSEKKESHSRDLGFRPIAGVKAIPKKSFACMDGKDKPETLAV